MEVILFPIVVSESDYYLFHQMGEVPIFQFVCCGVLFLPISVPIIHSKGKVPSSYFGFVRSIKVLMFFIIRLDHLK